MKIEYPIGTNQDAPLVLEPMHYDYVNPVKGCRMTNQMYNWNNLLRRVWSLERNIYCFDLLSEFFKMGRVFELLSITCKSRLKGMC